MHTIGRLVIQYLKSKFKLIMRPSSKAITGRDPVARGQVLLRSETRLSRSCLLVAKSRFYDSGSRKSYLGVCEISREILTFRQVLAYRVFFLWPPTKDGTQITTTDLVHDRHEQPFCFENVDEKATILAHVNACRVWDRNNENFSNPQGRW